VTIRSRQKEHLVKKGEKFMNTILRYARLQEGLTQEELASILGTTAMSIWRWESGKTVPSTFYRMAICAYFKREPAEFGWPQNYSKVTNFSLPRYLPRVTSSRKRRQIEAATQAVNTIL
jgi:transcriptional regulator with XRE-family HTH domain